MQMEMVFNIIKLSLMNLAIDKLGQLSLEYNITRCIIRF